MMLMRPGCIAKYKKKLIKHLSFLILTAILHYSISQSSSPFHTIKDLISTYRYIFPKAAPINVRSNGNVLKD